MSTQSETPTRMSQVTAFSQRELLHQISHDVTELLPPCQHLHGKSSSIQVSRDNSLSTVDICCMDCRALLLHGRHPESLRGWEGGETHKQRQWNCMTSVRIPPAALPPRSRPALSIRSTAQSIVKRRKGSKIAVKIGEWWWMHSERQPNDRERTVKGGDRTECKPVKAQ